MTLGCTRNDVDSEELAGRLSAEGWDLVDDAADADVAVVNTCGFVEQAKKDSIDALLEAADLKDPESGARTRAVVAVGCMAERYGEQLASQLPEADAVLGFDSYASMSDHLATILGGGRVASHTPSRPPEAPAAVPDRPAGCRRCGLDARVTGRRGPGSPTHAYGPPVVRARLDHRPWAPLKIASGCDRRCSFCAIPMFRGAYLSRRPADVIAEARWLAGEGVREVFLVSENSTSYGKDSRGGARPRPAPPILRRCEHDGRSPGGGGELRPVDRADVVAADVLAQRVELRALPAHPHRGAWPVR